MSRGIPRICRGEPRNLANGAADFSKICRGKLWALVICLLTACTPRAAPGPTLGHEYGKLLPFFTNKCHFFVWNPACVQNVSAAFIAERETRLLVGNSTHLHRVWEGKGKKMKACSVNNRHSRVVQSCSSHNNHTKTPLTWHTYVKWRQRMSNTMWVLPVERL